MIIPMIANVIGITIMSFKEKLPVLEDTTMTINKDESIVVGIEYFFIPKYKGIRDIPVAAIAFINMEGICCITTVVVNVSGIN